MQIEVPAGFHGHVQIVCNGVLDSGASGLHVSSGTMSAATCPARQVAAVVTRAGNTTPVPTTIQWTSTGDGLVRQISFDVP